jgi:hypothetical protein
MFYYDVFGLIFEYAFFYLTPCDKDSGAHQLIRQSHYSRPAKTLFSSARQDEEMRRGLYGADRFEIVEGPAGFGFVEGTSCFHRARPTVTAPRLALQIRYA